MIITIHNFHDYEFEMPPIPDKKDLEIIQTRAKERQYYTVPLVGDIIYMQDGSRRCISYDWGERGVQTSFGGSIHLCSNGQGSFSGGLEAITARSRIQKTGKYELSTFWIFHHGIPAGGMGLRFSIPVMCWEEIEV